MDQSEEFDRYYLATAKRHALWENETAMFIVLVLPLTVAAFWYGSTIQVSDLVGHVTAPATVSRGIGLALLITLFAIVGGATYLYVQPAAERIVHAQPVRGRRRLAFAAFDGLLVGLITLQSLPDVRIVDGVPTALITITVGVVAAVVAYVAMHSMVAISVDPASLVIASGGRVRGER